SGFSGGNLLQPKQLSDLYHFDDFARKLFARNADEALREGVEITNPRLDETQIQAVTDAWEALGAQAAILEGSIWGRVYGLGGIYLATNQADPNKPWVPGSEIK